MSIQGDNRKLHRERYQRWMRRRWRERAEAARARRLGERRKEVAR